MALKRKSNPSSTSVTSKKQIIKVNPYENADNVMELMANICAAVPNADTNIYWNTISDAYNKEVMGKSLCQYLKDNRGNLFNGDFEHDLNNYCQQLSWCLSARENTEHTQIVVAGGFSSGKSSFLNRLTNSTNLLPTGVEPVSVVKTYLYCSSNNCSISVKGVNHKNVLVDLNKGVLQAIQHAKKSNIFLASVLDKLFVEIPSQGLDGLVFIDTPGYNNSDKANQSNGKTDRETAVEALREGNVLFWLIDCERGTTVSDDIDIIKQFNGKKVFIFNKADKKGYQECQKIIDNAALTLYNEFPEEEIIDIIAYSARDNKIYCSKNNMSLNEIITEAKKSGNGVSELNSLRDQIDMLFDVEITASKNTIKSIEENYKEKLDWKNQSQELYRYAKDNRNSLVSELQEVLVKSYNELDTVADNMYESSSYALDSFRIFYNGVLHFERTDHWGSSSLLDGYIDKASSTYKTALDKHNSATDMLNSLAGKYGDEDYRKGLVERVDKEEDFIVDHLKDLYEDACKDCENALEGKEIEKVMIKDMKKYRLIFMSAIDSGIKQYQQQNKATKVHKEDYIVPNVFDCIKKDNYKLFLHSFEDGVDLSICNADGFNPLTLAVQTGNNMMVQFLLDHDADPSIKDKRGYNAFHTAVENQYRDICKILLDVDPELIETKTSSGETVEELAKKQTFTKWIENEIDNAF